MNRLKMRYTFKKLLQKEGWKENITISCDEDGVITEIVENSNDKGQQIDGIAFPGFQNAHSHSFQYAMCGLAEVHPVHTQDDFWSWRENMYHLALRLSPDDFETIATQLYYEMIRHGYTHVAEFHYLHHDISGNKYNNIAEMGERLISAAQKTGINITLIPIFYQKGGFGMPPTEKQKRFISFSEEDYLELFEKSAKATKKYKGANIALGIHSLRAVELPLVQLMANHWDYQNIPFHIHISEQLKEVNDCIDYTGKRPVEWMLDHVEMSQRFHLVHATHLTESEVKGIAQSGAHVVLCPSTEGNLGDGIFPLIDFQKSGGKWSIGTDSHIGLNPLEELRTLDYGQRLTSHKRNIFASDTTGNTGEFAIQMATLSGRKAMNDDSEEYFSVGSKLNAVVYYEKEKLAARKDEFIASTLVYSGDIRWNAGTIVNGRFYNPSHGEEHEEKFIKVLKKIM